MTDLIYPKYKEALLSGASDISLDTETVKVSLLDTDVQAQSNTDQFYSDINENAEIGTVVLANTSVSNGVFSADDVSIVPESNTESEALLLWIDTANTETSRLVAWLDDSVTGLPITPNGSNVDITWNQSGIFQL
jgi:hypothetical protein